MPSYPIFVGPGGADPTKHLLSLAAAIHPTVGDALYAGQIVRSRILTRTGQGVDVDGSTFQEYSDSYRKQKIRHLGHADTVDLFGFQQHAHMLNTVLVKASGGELMPGQPASGDPQSDPLPANLFEVGFYGLEEAGRARIHNEGGTFRTRKGTGKGKQSKRSLASSDTATMPRRHFFDANQQDLSLMAAAIGERMMLRAKAAK